MDIPATCEPAGKLLKTAVLLAIIVSSPILA
jgi:hypothetical protein